MVEGRWRVLESMQDYRQAPKTHPRPVGALYRDPLGLACRSYIVYIAGRTCVQKS